MTIWGKWHNTILFPALVPNEIDRNGDLITEAEITKTAHEFITNLQNKWANVNHDEQRKIHNSNFKYVESFIAPIDIWNIPKGSWVLGIKLTDEYYEKFLNWDFVWISIEWEAFIE